MNSILFSSRPKLILILGILVLFGCTTESSVAIKTPTPKDVISIQSTKTPTTEKAVTSTVTHQPTLAPTYTQTPTLGPTYTEVPKLSPEEALAMILKFYTDNGGCELPCWWGITPGKTTWAEANAQLSPLGTVYVVDLDNGKVRYDFEIAVPPEIDPVGYILPAIIVEDDVVTELGINGRWIAQEFDYSLAGLLDTFGEPNEIWISIFPEEIAGPAYYAINIVYNRKGLIGYTGYATVSDGVFAFCPQDIFSRSEFPPGMLLWPTEKEITYKNIEDSNLAAQIAQNKDDYMYLDHLAEEWDTKTFFQTYLDPNTTECINVSLDTLP